MAAKFGVFVDEDLSSFRIYTGYLKITFLKGPIANSSSCPTSGLSYF